MPASTECPHCGDRVYVIELEEIGDRVFGLVAEGTDSMALVLHTPLSCVKYLRQETLKLLKDVMTRDTRITALEKEIVRLNKQIADIQTAPAPVWEGVPGNGR